MQARLKPCIKRENINHRACTNEGCSLFLYRAQPVSEMERRARNRAARHEPSGAKAQPVSEMERERGIELQGVSRPEPKRSP